MDEQKSVVPKKEEPNLIAIFSYLGLLFLIPLFTNKDDSFVQFHAKQGLVLFVFEAATAIFGMIPILGWFGAPLLYVFWFILSIIGIINVVKGKQEKLPVIGNLSHRFKI